MKKWSSHTRFLSQNMTRWCQNLLLLNYSYAFERSVAPASLIILDYTLAHTWLYSWARYVLSRAMIFRFHQCLHLRVRKKKTKRFTTKLSKMWLQKNRACDLSKWKSNPSFQIALSVSHFDRLVHKNYQP